MKILEPEKLTISQLQSNVRILEYIIKDAKTLIKDAKKIQNDLDFSIFI